MTHPPFLIQKQPIIMYYFAIHTYQHASQPGSQTFSNNSLTFGFYTIPLRDYYH